MPLDRDTFTFSIDWQEVLQNVRAEMAELNNAMEEASRVMPAFDILPPAWAPEELAPWERELLNIGNIPMSESGSTVAGQAQSEVGNPNTISEGEAMPTETLTVQLPSSVRRQVFDNMGGANTLMSNLDLSNWESVLNALQGNLGPVQINVSRGGFEIADQIPSTHATLGRIYLDYLLVDEAREVISIASDGKMLLELVPNPDDAGNPIYYKLRPLNNIDSNSFLRYTGEKLYPLTYQDDVGRIALADLRQSMRGYLQYRARRRSYIRETIRTQMVTTLAGPTPAQIAERKISRNTNLFNFMENVKKKSNVDKDPFRKMAILPHGTIASRRWGIEIEACDVGGIETPEHWALHGDGSLRPAHDFSAAPDVDHEEECGYWADEEEDSCDCGAASGEQERLTERNRDNIVSQSTGEWNSPILHSFHSRGLQHLSEKLVPRYTNSSAGVHVHVEAADLTPDQAVQLSLFYSALEPLWEKEYHRTVRNYCKSVDAKELLDRMDIAKNIKGKPATAFAYGRRYFTVNMAALNTHGTIEFRAMGNIYEYDHLVRWAHFCREMVNLAKANIPQKAWTKVNKFEDLILLFAKYGKETPYPDWAPDAVVDFDPIVALLGKENRLKPNARPSHAYTQNANQVPPVELFDDYTQRAVATTANPSHNVLSRRVVGSF